ncbi:S-adenosyl-L-methionine-dependent methyltransferase [Gautieria morchelliformis]|nr:S-adenosyl-L-methionine-dependent methyltransferase [Gautieria morchelliformis]
MSLNLQQLISKDGAQGWEKAWQSRITPWDAGYTQPPLEAILKNGEITFPKVGTALVPGCGKGYDAILIGSYLGLQTTGVDISSTAISLANENLRSQSPIPTNVKFEQRDFFEIKDAFDLVCDYTFFQALPPTLRGRWGIQMSSIVKSGGYLIILAFPTHAPLDASGPPHGITENSHQVVLGDDWEKLLDRIPENSSKIHVGVERLMVWRKN